MAGSFTSLLLSEQLLIAFQSIGSINNVDVVVHESGGVCGSDR